MGPHSLLKQLLPRSQFGRSVSVLAGGTVAAQVIVILASPLLTRLFSPEDFGLLAVFAALVGVFVVLASLRYELAIPLPESDEEAAHLVALSVLVVLGMTALSIIAVGFLRQPVAQTLNVPTLAEYLWLFPIGILVIGLYQIFNYWAIRSKAFSAISRTKLTQSLGMVVIQVGGYMLGPFALLIGWLAGHAAGTTSLGALTVRTRWHSFKHLRATMFRQVAIRYRRFPLYSTWAAVFTTAGRESPPILFAALFSASGAGIYMLAHRVLALPMAMIGRAIADVFLSHAAEARRNGQLAPLVAQLHEKLSHFAMPPTLILIVAGPDLFAFVFGESWRQAGEFARWMAPMVYVLFVTAPLNHLFLVLEKQPQAMLLQWTIFTTRVAAVFIGAYYHSITLAVALFACGSTICMLGGAAWIAIANNNRLSDLWHATVRALGWSILLVSPLLIAKIPDAPYLLSISALMLTTALIVARYFSLLKTDNLG